jgi:ribonucleotide monophosphatase NagD (HAD superfamily)
LLDAASAPPLLARLDTLIFDQDGVLWRGQDLIPNAIEVWRALKRQQRATQRPQH